MKEDKIKSYILVIILFVILFFALFVQNIFTKIVLAVIVTIHMLITKSILKKKNILSICHKQVEIVMLLIGILYLMIFYIMGIYFGFYEAVVKFSKWSLINFTIPIAVIIISSEVTRNILLNYKDIKFKVLTTISMIILDLIIYANMNQFNSFEGFVNIISYSFFASISCNLLYNYISKRYGSRAVIIFRLLTSLYPYILPIIPNVYMFFRCFLKIICPYIIYLILEKCFSKDNFVIAARDRKKNIIITVIMTIVMILMIMLVSCKFKYGILVVGSGSMTGELNKGDAVIYEAYNEHELQEGKVIIFEKDDIITIHRIIDIKQVKNELRYYTKGDANQNRDEGYRLEKDIRGIVKIKIKYIGYPSLWLRDIFEK
jgi:signal peptidase